MVHAYTYIYIERERERNNLTQELTVSLYIPENILYNFKFCRREEDKEQSARYINYLSWETLKMFGDSDDNG